MQLNLNLYKFTLFNHKLQLWFSLRLLKITINLSYDKKLENYREKLIKI